MNRCRCDRVICSGDGSQRIEDMWARLGNPERRPVLPIALLIANRRHRSPVARRPTPVKKAARCPQEARTRALSNVECRLGAVQGLALPPTPSHRNRGEKPGGPEGAIDSELRGCPPPGFAVLPPPGGVAIPLMGVRDGEVVVSDCAYGFEVSYSGS